MSSLAERLARPEVLALKPYATAYADGARAQAVKLDANENPYETLISESIARNINRYPEPQPAALLARLASLYSVNTQQILITRGADEGIDLLTRAFCRPAQDSIVVCPPTFDYYETAALVQGASVTKIPLTSNFEIDIEKLLGQAAGVEPAKILFLCSPMNPTGNSISPADICRLCEAFNNSIVAVDEAYIEFSTHASQAEHLNRYDNLAILRTLSKAYGLAGARCGAVLANEDIITVLKQISVPYPISTVTACAVAETLAPVNMPIIRRRIAELQKRRDEVASEITGSEMIEAVYTSDANFLLVKASDPETFANCMAQNGLQVRRREAVFPGAFRISIGTEAEMQLLLEAIGLTSDTLPQRTAEHLRKTKETAISCWINLDSSQNISIDTGIGFYDHMLEQIAKHAGISLTLNCVGDLHIDGHHTIEDCALTFGATLKKALGDMRGVGRFGFVLPMDETEAQISVDIAGRPYILFEGEFKAPLIGEYPTEMTEHVFRSIAESLGASIHVNVQGENDHHMTEACFKAFGRALRTAVAKSGSDIPSTKGVL